MVHSACTIHLLNLPEPDAKRDIIHGVKNLEEIAQDWLCARRTLSIISVLARKWKSDLPDEASAVLARTDAKYGFFSTSDVPSPKSDLLAPSPRGPTSPQSQQASQAFRNQNSLMESLYSYALPVTNQNPNADINTAAETSSKALLQERTSTQSPLAPTISIAASDTYNMSSPIPHTAAQQTLPLTTTSNEVPPHSAPYVRRISPSTLFGGVEMLVESQDMWLREQANLPVAFDNWMDMANSGQGAEFFMGDERKGNETGYGLDESWQNL